MHMKTIPAISASCLLVSALLLLAAVGQGEGESQAHGEYWVYVGSAIYEGGGSSKDIYISRFNAKTGKLSTPEVAVDTVNPGFLAIDRNGRFLYATNELGDYKGLGTGAVSAFAIDRKTGKLTFLNAVSSLGKNPAHLSIDKTGKYVLVANYYGGRVGVFPILKDGRLGEAVTSVHLEGSSVNRERQEAPHPHSIYLSPDNRFVLVPDLGQDKVLVYRFDASNGSLTPNDPPFAPVHPGAGPRHLAFSKDGRFVYVIDEIQSAISVFSYDAQRGVLHPVQMLSTLPKDFKGENTDAEVEVSHDGRFLYTSDRGYNGTTVFEIDRDKGTLRPIQYESTQGKTPRHFALDPTGSYLLAANQDSNNIVIFRVDKSSGRLSPTGETVQAISPTCIVFLAVK
jgi:6-phosphogluconolactonase